MNEADDDRGIGELQKELDNCKDPDERDTIKMIITLRERRRRGFLAGPGARDRARRESPRGEVRRPRLRSRSRNAGAARDGGDEAGPKETAAAELEVQRIGENPCGTDSA